MELFTLGIGHYTEDDVKEAARALTGWTVADGAVLEYAVDDHDDGEKTILGKTGAVRRRRPAADLCSITRRRPTGWPGGSARRSSARRRRRRAGLERAGRAACGSDDLRHRLGGRDGPPLAGCSSPRRTCGTRVSDPVEFVVGAVRALELFDPPPSTLVLADWAARLGQDLFYPPNVGGWPGGPELALGPRGIVARANFAAALVGGRLGVRGHDRSTCRAGRTSAAEANDPRAVGFLASLLTAGDPTAAAGSDRSSGRRGPAARSDAERLNRAVALHPGSSRSPAGLTDRSPCRSVLTPGARSCSRDATLLQGLRLDRPRADRARLPRRGPPAPRRPERDGRVLVVVQLDGGNDGINTVVPFGDEGYAKHRKELRLPDRKLIKIDDGVGLHPAMRRRRKLLESGPAGDRAGRRLSEPEPLALREHGDLADGATRHPGQGEHGLAGPGAGPQTVAEPGPGRDSRRRSGSASRTRRTAGRDDVVRGRFGPDPDLARGCRLELPEECHGDDLAAFVQPHGHERLHLGRRARGRDIAGRGGSARYPETDLAGRLDLVGTVDQGRVAGPGVLPDPGRLRHARGPVAHPLAAAR